MVKSRRERCFLCSAVRGPKIGLHRFPKDPAVRAAWISFCGLNEATDNVNTLLLCSSHFGLSDYPEPRAREFGNPLKLKPKSVPSVLKPKSQNKHHSTPLLTGDYEPEVETSHSAYLRVASFASQFSDLEEGTSQLQLPKNLPEPVEDVQQTPKGRRFAEPRYMGDIRTPDFATPRRAKLCFGIAKAKIDKQSLQIKTLRQKNRRLLKKLHTMEDLLNQLRNKNLISENCQEG